MVKTLMSFCKKNSTKVECKVKEIGVKENAKGRS